MKTYLLAWNPKRWNWEDLSEMSDDVKEGKLTIIQWSCNKSKQIQIGDRAYFIRLGENPRGIFASGTVKEGSYEDLHWIPEKKAAGKTSYYIRVQLDTLLDPMLDPMLSLEILNSPPLSEMHWTVQFSGVHIPDNIAEELEIIWSKFTKEEGFWLPEEIEENGEMYEGAMRTISVNAYERNPEARKKCITHYTATCSVCGFNFEQTYGKVGKDFIHVHHLKQISDVGEAYQVDPILDLRPVCPNCHAIIHRRKPAYTIEEVKKFLDK